MGFLLLIPKITTIFIFFCCLQSPISQAKIKRFDKQYGDPFDHTYFPIFELKHPAQISNQALQVTPDTASADYQMFNNSGRILLKQPFKLWESDDNKDELSRVASFNTSFLVNIYRPKNDTPAEGLAFLICPDLDLPPNSQGQYLGLTNRTTEGDASNRIIAVELDTFKQDFDIDDNHIGIDVNSVKSVKSKSLTPLGIKLAPIGARFYNIWVTYDGIKKVLNVYIAEQKEKNGSTPLIPNEPILTHNIDLRKVVNQVSYFGFSASTGHFNQLNCVLRWNLTVEYFQEKNHHKLITIGLSVGLPVAVLLVVFVIFSFWYYNKKRGDTSEADILGALKSLPGMPRDFEFNELKKATNNFSEKNKLGEGGFGVVYKGYLVGEKLEIAVKWFSRESIKGQDDFLAELTIINRLRHKHLVKLLGWSHKHGKLLLVYEYMPNGSLDKHLFSDPEKEPPLSWRSRYNIVSGVASALNYLHNEYEQKVVHRDLKANNIMLDSNFNARLGDFGLARAIDNEKTSYADEAEGVLGTMGYIAPECFHTGKATQHSDVYAFGAVLLEVVCGQRPGTKVNGFQLFLDWVWFLHRDGRILEAVDTRLEGDYVAEEAKRLLLLALACSHPTASERPNTQTIAQVLSGSVPAPEVPPFKPAFVWPSMVPIDIESSIVDTISITTPQFSSGNNSMEYQSK